MFASPEDRWERIAQGLFVTGCCLVAATVYGVYSGEDWRGIVMTIAPAALVFGLWYMARERAEALLTGGTMALPAKIIAGVVVLGSIAFVVHLVRMSSQLQWVERDRQPEPRALRMPDNVRVIDGKLQRVEPEDTCAEWGSIPDTREGHEGEMFEFCKRGK